MGEIVRDNLNHPTAAWRYFVKYSGIQSIGNILASRKGIFGIVAIGLAYWLLLGRLPAEAPPELVAEMGEIFGLIVGVIAGLFIGGTALEDALKKGTRASGPKWLTPWADMVGKMYTDYSAGEDVDPIARLKALLEELEAKKVSSSTASDNT
jgi:hypothetical protein